MVVLSSEAVFVAFVIGQPPRDVVMAQLVAQKLHFPYISSWQRRKGWNILYTHTTSIATRYQLLVPASYATLL